MATPFNNTRIVTINVVNFTQIFDTNRPSYHHQRVANLTVDVQVSQIMLQVYQIPHAVFVLFHIIFI